MPDTPTAPAAPTLAEAWQAEKRRDPGARARDIAERLGVSEGALVEARTGEPRTGEGVRRLALAGEDFAHLVAALPDLGPVMTLTRNAAAVHETTGPVGAVARSGRMGQVTGAIDLRLFYRHWHAGHEVVEETRSGLRHSLQVFDGTGSAVLKIYAVAGTDMDAWERLVARFEDRGRRILAFAPPGAMPADPPDEEIDRHALRREWLSLGHSHDFAAMLRELGIGREQALRLAGDDLAVRADAGLARRVLEAAAAEALPVMVFVGNPGCLQIFTGPVARIVTMGPWLNVLDPGFNLHLRSDLVAASWVVVKPTKSRGRITSVEFFDAEGGLVCQIFGARAPGASENEAWRALLDRAVTGGAAQ